MTKSTIELADVVRDLAAQKRFVGAEVGILAVLHTWTGQLRHHPHVHMLVTGGGVTADGTAWHAASKKFLVPVRKLSWMIAKRFAAALQKDHPELFEQIPDKVWNQPWCSYSKPYGKGQQAVLNYLARYVFRVALTNRRLMAMDETHVTFQYKDHDTGSGIPVNEIGKRGPACCWNSRRRLLHTALQSSWLILSTRRSNKVSGHLRIMG